MTIARTSLKPGDIVSTDDFGTPHVGRVLYTRPGYGGSPALVVADWKAGTDITKNAATFQAGVDADRVN